MHGKSMRYVLVAAAALAAGLLLAGTSVQSLLPFVLLLACPLMMVVMMRGMGGQGVGHQHGAGQGGSPLGRQDAGARGGVGGGQGQGEGGAQAGSATVGGDPPAVFVDQSPHDR